MIQKNPYISIVKPRGSIMDVSVVALNCAILGTWDSRVLLIILAGIMVHGSCNVINDLFDYDIDKICKPDGAIRSGQLTIKNAWHYMAGLLVGGLLVSLSVSFFLFLCCTISFIIGGIMYSHPAFRFKDIPGIAMLNMAVCFSLLSIGAWSVYSPLNNQGFLVALYIFVLSFSLLFMKDFKDIEGDINSLPLMIGVKNAVYVCCFLTVIPLIPLFNLLMYDHRIIAGIIVYSFSALNCIKIMIDDPVAKGFKLKHWMQISFVVPSIIIFIALSIQI